MSLFDFDGMKVRLDDDMAHCVFLLACTSTLYLYYIVLQYMTRSFRIYPRQILPTCFSAFHDAFMFSPCKVGLDDDKVGLMCVFVLTYTLALYVCSTKLDQTVVIPARCFLPAHSFSFCLFTGLSLILKTCSKQPFISGYFDYQEFWYSAGLTNFPFHSWFEMSITFRVKT